MEVQIEIGLPDEKGRGQILNIHSSKMKENSFLSPDVDLAQLGNIFFVFYSRFCSFKAYFLETLAL